MAKNRKVRVVFVAHPISGDIPGNIKKALAILKKIHTKWIIPYAPYIACLQYLDDAVLKHRRLGIMANLEMFLRRYIDELWLFGNRISGGMKEEVLLAIKLGIPIFAKTPETERDLKNLIFKMARGDLAGEMQKLPGAHVITARPLNDDVAKFVKDYECWKVKSEKESSLVFGG